ncbi:MAG: DUF4465 domain-containing protein [Bacteroidales bacterium]|nr:DUF4465 domain-containing protein [Bacteroidales bacterium]
MKKFLLLVLAVMMTGLLLQRCDDYDDQEIWDAVHNLDGRVGKLEKFNGTLMSEGTLTDAFNKQLTIKKIESGESGYTIFFSDNTTATITNGEDAEGLFVSVDNTAEDFVIITMQDGSELQFARYDAEAPVFEIAEISEQELFKPAETRTYEVTAENVVDWLIVKPDGWKATLADGILSVTAPAEDNPYAEQEGIIAIQVIGTNGKSLVKRFNVGPRHFELRVLTFEDADYKASENYLGFKSWSSLIDDPQYGGQLLYGESGWGPTDYNWYDENNTFIGHVFPVNWGTTSFAGGGHAISNYMEADLSKGDYTLQLALYRPDGATTGGGHNGSENFCVHMGYHDNSGYSGDNLPELYFGDGVARVIDHMYVNNTLYALNVFKNGNSFAPAIGEGDWVKIIATGYNEDGEETGTCEFYLGEGPDKIVTDWTKWNLSSLGEVLTVSFNITGTADNGYGFSQPAYFAYDDVAVRFYEEDEEDAVEVTEE